MRPTTLPRALLRLEAIRARLGHAALVTVGRLAGTDEEILDDYRAALEAAARAIHEGGRPSPVIPWVGITAPDVWLWRCDAWPDPPIPGIRHVTCTGRTRIEVRPVGSGWGLVVEHDDDYWYGSDPLAWRGVLLTDDNPYVNLGDAYFPWDDDPPEGSEGLSRPLSDLLPAELLLRMEEWRGIHGRASRLDLFDDDPIDDVVDGAIARWRQGEGVEARASRLDLDGPTHVWRRPAEDARAVMASRHRRSPC